MTMTIKRHLDISLCCSCRQGIQTAPGPRTEEESFRCDPRRKGICGAYGEHSTHGHSLCLHVTQLCWSAFFFIPNRWRRKRNSWRRMENYWTWRRMTLKWWVKTINTYLKLRLQNKQNTFQSDGQVLFFNLIIFPKHLSYLVYFKTLSVLMTQFSLYQFKQAVYKQTMKLFAELEIKRKEREAKEMHER